MEDPGCQYKNQNECNRGDEPVQAIEAGGDQDRCIRWKESSLLDGDIGQVDSEPMRRLIFHGLADEGVQVVGLEGLFDHGNTSSFDKTSRRRWRARKSRVFTVPTGQTRAAAIFSSGQSCR